MEVAAKDKSSAFRSVTPEEINHYRQHGWVKLEKFIPAPQVAELLAMATDLMGEKGDRNPPPMAFSYFNPLTMRGLDDPLLRPIIDHVGRGARALMARRAPIGIRYFTDYFAVKLPSGSAAEHGGNGSSDWHQDYAASASDRSGGMVFWMALTDMPPELGTMRFLNGSHRYGVMGHYATYGKGNLLDSYPELLDDCTDSGQLSYAAGDVTVHSNMCVHGAGANLTDKPRWTYIVIVNPADACWNGGPADAFDTTGLQLHKEMDDGRFPVIT
ncbi:phytanoyl-CoA dioxygenase family protein [Phenylobacterium sp. LjRoot225]|uniref:phytanoyl-CoA dioxygenase family protein n=1 Tax=Phenylobacterium sp. LjRoot225 TaxID=3342285 RepID=UPI003ECF431D